MARRRRQGRHQAGLTGTEKSWKKSTLEEKHMARRLIDISVPLQNDVPADPPGLHPAIQYSDHQQSLPRMLQFFDGLKAEDLARRSGLGDGNGPALDP